jgi:predicted nucleotidyltransferase
MFSLTRYLTKESVEAFCVENHIKKLSVFGSALLNEEKPESDIDILVEFDPDHIPGLLELAGMEIELAEKAGRNIDLRTPEELSRFFRQEVLAKARTEYAAR